MTYLNLVTVLLYVQANGGDENALTIHKKYKLEVNTLMGKGLLKYINNGNGDWLTLTNKGNLMLNTFAHILELA